MFTGKNCFAAFNPAVMDFPALALRQDLAPQNGLCGHEAKKAQLRLPAEDKSSALILSGKPLHRGCVMNVNLVIERQPHIYIREHR